MIVLLQYFRHNLFSHRQKRSNSWIKNTQDFISKSQKERNSSQIIRIEINKEMLECANTCFHTWYQTNSSLKDKIEEIMKAQRTNWEAYNELSFNIEILEPQISEIRDALEAKIPALKV